VFEDSIVARNRLEDDICYLNFIKRLLVLVDNQPQTQVLILNEAA